MLFANGCQKLDSGRGRESTSTRRPSATCYTAELGVEAKNQTARLQEPVTSDARHQVRLAPEVSPLRFNALTCFRFCGPHPIF